MTRTDAPQPVGLDPRYYENAKVELLDAVGRELHLRCLCHANLHWTDGFVPHATAIRLATLSLTSPGSGITPDPRQALNLIDQLLDVGLLDDAEGGFDIHDYALYQETRESFERREEEERRAQERDGWRRRKRRQRNRDTSRFGPAEVTADLRGPGSPRDVLEGQSDLTFTTSESSYSDSDPLSWANVHRRLRGADHLTPAVIRTFAAHFNFAEAPLADAWAALQARRVKRPALVSEAKYFVSVLKDARESGRFAA